MKIPMSPFSSRVAAVIGGGGGIGSCVALEFARRGATVVVVDPGVGVEGELLGETTAADTANRIISLGGSAVSSTTSVTDRAALRTLFDETTEAFGSLDFVVNASGILRFAELVDTVEDDWSAVLDVHFNGFVNVLACAVPIMAKAGFGRIVGLTSGSGLARTSPGNIAYGTAKRAVAAITWELGHRMPAGVRVNALSPIAATRMVRSAIFASAGGRRAKHPKEVDLSSMPQPEDMAKATVFLVSEEAEWTKARVIFSTGSEITMIAPPRLLEAVRTEQVENFPVALSTLVPEVFVPAEAAQRTGGGANSRFGDIFNRDLGSPPSVSARGNCLIVCDDKAIASGLELALGAWGMTPISIGGSMRSTVDSPGPAGFDDPLEMLSTAVEEFGEVDAVVIVGGLLNSRPSTDHDSWPQLIESHSTVVPDVMFHGSWLRAAARYSKESVRPIRVVHLSTASTPADRTASQAIAQMARNANDIALTAPFDVYAVSLEACGPADIDSICALSARLVCAEDTRALRGAEFVANRGWIGLRCHPAPEVTVSFGGPDLPAWINGAFLAALGR